MCLQSCGSLWSCVPLTTAPLAKAVMGKCRDSGWDGKRHGYGEVWIQGRGCDNPDSADFQNGERFLNILGFQRMFFGQPVNSLPPCWAQGRGWRWAAGKGGARRLKTSWHPQGPSVLVTKASGAAVGRMDCQSRCPCTWGEKPPFSDLQKQAWARKGQTLTSSPLPCQLLWAWAAFSRAETLDQAAFKASVSLSAEGGVILPSMVGARTMLGRGCSQL